MPHAPDADLPARIALAMAYVSRWCERRLNDGVLDPHNYGRAVDALLKGAAASGTPAPEPIVDRLRSVLLALTDNPLGFPHADGGTDPHDLREIVQAFTELGTARDDHAARQRLGRLLDAWLRLTNPDGTWRADLIAAEPGLRHPGFTDDHGVESAPPRSRARSVMALTHLFRLTGDQRALELADRFVRLARAKAFIDDGRLTMLLSLLAGRNDTVSFLPAYTVLPWVQDVRASAGEPMPVFDGAAGFGIVIHRSILPRWARHDRLICISATGDSMTPALRDGDLVILDYSQTEPVSGQVFVVRAEAGLIVKRLRGRPGGAWTLTSDNPRYRPVPVRAADRIIGRVAWSGPPRDR